MTIGYDPFKYADIWGSEEEYLQELIKDERNRQNDDSSNNDRTEFTNTDKQ